MLLVGVLGNLATFVVGATLVLHAVLQGFFGDPGDATAAGHFASLPAAVAAAVVGSAGWAYQRGFVRSGALAQSPARPALPASEIDRAYAYLAAAVGLVTMVAGITMAFVALFDAALRPTGLPGDARVGNVAVVAVTLRAVGASLWLAFWRGIQCHLTFDDQRSITRRVYLLVLFGAAAAVALVCLVVLLIFAFEDVTAGEAGRDVVAALRADTAPRVLVLARASGGFDIVPFREEAL